MDNQSFEAQLTIASQAMRDGGATETLVAWVAAQQRDWFARQQVRTRKMSDADHDYGAYLQELRDGCQ